jgi:hypothetical protein
MRFSSSLVVAAFVAAADSGACRLVSITLALRIELILMKRIASWSQTGLKFF